MSMKIWTILISSFLLFFGSPQEVPHTTIEKAMKSNDAKTIVALGKEKIVLQILGKEGAFNHTQAETILNDFFVKKPKGDFNFNFKGKENAENVVLSVGTYVVNKENFRCSFQFRTEKSVSKMESLIIEKQ